MPTYHELVAASKAGKCPAPGTILRRIGKLTDLKSKFDSVLLKYWLKPHEREKCSIVFNARVLQRGAPPFACNGRRA